MVGAFLLKISKRIELSEMLSVLSLGIINVICALYLVVEE